MNKFVPFCALPGSGCSLSLQSWWGWRCIPGRWYSRTCGRIRRTLQTHFLCLLRPIPDVSLSVINCWLAAVPHCRAATFYLVKFVRHQIKDYKPKCFFPPFFCYVNDTPISSAIYPSFIFWKCIKTKKLPKCVVYKRVTNSIQSDVPSMSLIEIKYNSVWIPFVVVVLKAITFIIVQSENWGN